MNATLSRELNGILHKIVDNLEQFVTIAFNLQAFHGTLERDGYIGCRLICVDHLLEQLIQIDMCHQQALRTGFDLRHTHQSVDDTQQLTIVILDLRDKLVTLLIALNDR